MPGSVQREIVNAAGFIEGRVRAGMNRSFHVGRAHGAAQAALELGTQHAGPLRGMLSLTALEWATLAELAQAEAQRRGNDAALELEGKVRGIALAVRATLEEEDDTP